MKAIFIRAIEAGDKAQALTEAIRDPESTARFDVDPERFRAVPRSPFAYWVSEQFRGMFERFPRFEAQRRELSIGASTKNDFRYVRLAQEIGPRAIGRSRRQTRSRPWVLFAKGGAFSPHYADVQLAVLWRDDGAELKADISEYRGRRGWGFQWSAALNGHAHYFRPGLTWPRRTNGLSFRPMPAGCIFADKGPAVFAEGDDPEALLALCAVANSAPFSALVALQLARTELAQSYEVGLIQQTPVPGINATARDQLALLARRAWCTKFEIDSRTETSHAFVLPALLQVPGATLWCRAQAWRTRVAAAEAELASIQAEIDEFCFALYDIDDKDRRRIELGLAGRVDVSDEVEGGDEVEADNELEELEEIDVVPLVTALLSWSVGVAFGRFDVRVATVNRLPLAEAAPFDPLPPCSPGMLTGTDSLPAATPPSGYPIDITREAVLIDDNGHDDDVVSRARHVFQLVFGDDAHDRWQEATEMLGEGSRDLRAWFARAFFENHIKRYSKSRRKAPIYWQLATTTASYSVWVYCHRFTGDTLYRVLNEYVAPKLKHEERKLTSLTQEAGSNPPASHRKEIEDQKSFVTELRAFRDEVARVAPLWKPDLNDGVIINFAPLWRLVPQQRQWQKECKSCFDKLHRGDYDWAHLAMHLWPERVVPKCAEDRSLAIAHGLDDLFWYEDSDGKWQPRNVEQTEIDQLIKERTSAAVKDALKSLLEVPAPTTRRASRKNTPRTKGTRKRTASINPPAAASALSNRSLSSAAADMHVLSKVKEAIAAIADGVSKADVIDATGITAAQWNKAIKALLADGSVTQVGERRGARYYLSGGDDT